MGNAGSTSARIEAIDGLRAVAMLLVFAFHLHARLAEHYPHAFWPVIRNIGPCGTDMFLTLTGCLVFRSLIRRSVPYFEFLSRRVNRIYPLFLTVLVAYIVTDALWPECGKLPVHAIPALWAIAKNALLLPGLLGEQPVVMVTWTLSYIFAFYVVCPPLASLLRTRTKTARANASLFLFAAAIAASQTGVLRMRVAMLFAGMLLAEASGLRGRWSAAVAAVAFPLQFLTSGIAGFAIHALALAAICHTVVSSSWANPRILRSRALLWLGQRSYAFYLCHGLPLLVAEHCLMRRFHGPWTFWLVQPASFAAAVAVSHLAYEYVEKRWQPSGAARPADPLRVIPVPGRNLDGHVAVDHRLAGEA